MGISTAYLNDLVIAGHLKKRRRQSSTGFSTALWINPQDVARREVDPTRCGGSAAQTSREALHLWKRQVMGITWSIPPLNGGFFMACSTTNQHSVKGLQDPGACTGQHEGY
jgi:hypothetical protein